MNIKLELISKEIAEVVFKSIEKLEFDPDTVAQTTAIAVLSEIQDVLKKSEYSDFEIVEKIVCIFEKYKIDCGTCHDFG